MPKVRLRIINGQAIFEDKDVLATLNDGVYEVTIKNMDYRSLQQNKALHLYFQLVADALTDAGLDIKHVIKADVPWTAQSVKSILWKSLQKALLGKESTTKLKKDEIDKVYDVMNRVLSERYGIYVPFPNRDKI